MRFVIPLAIIAGLGAASFALAEAPTRELKADAQPRAISDSDLKAQIERLGYDVRKLKAEERHYEAQIVERASGGAVEATYDKSSGELLAARPASESHQTHEHEKAREHREPGKADETRERAEAGKDRDSRAHGHHDADD